MCREIALFYAKSQFPSEDIEAIAISCDAHFDEGEFITPCGGCRQVMVEYEKKQEKEITVLMWDNNEKDGKVLKIESCSQLMPLSFWHKSIGN